LDLDWSKTISAQLPTNPNPKYCERFTYQTQQKLTFFLISISDPAFRSKNTQVAKCFATSVKQMQNLSYNLAENEYFMEANDIGIICTDVSSQFFHNLLAGYCRRACRVSPFCGEVCGCHRKC
jgi:hypothetical protein